MNEERTQFLKNIKKKILSRLFRVLTPQQQARKISSESQIRTLCEKMPKHKVPLIAVK